MSNEELLARLPKSLQAALSKWLNAYAEHVHRREAIMGGRGCRYTPAEQGAASQASIAAEEEALCEILLCVDAARLDCARIASKFSMKADRSLHPDIPWEQMSESARMAAHTCAQQIAQEISSTVSPVKRS